MGENAELPGTSIAGLTGPVQVAVAPFATVAQLTIETVGSTKGSPPAWRQRARGALETWDFAVLDPVFGADCVGVLPDCLVPRPEAFSVSFDDELERVAAVSAEELVAALASDDLLGSTPWSPVAGAPRRWRDGYVGALGRAWEGVGPLWRQAAPFLEREVERVGTALARGAVDQVLDGLYPDGRVEQDRWFIEGGTTPATIAPRLVLVPMLVGSKARFWHQDDHGGVDYVAYPLPGAHRLAWSDGQAAHDHATGLDGLLGAPRAEILRRLDRVVPAGVLACHLQCAPSVITHHLVALERAGLVRRERSGRRVFVHRTARGTALLHLYEG